MSRGAHILVVDDDPMFRTLLVSLLGEQHRVTIATEGSEGFYKALENPPDLVLVDVRMPGWDGLQTLRAFRSSRMLAHCRMMMLTGDASRDTVLACVRAGADDYLIKTSFSKAELGEKLERLLEDVGTEHARPPHTRIDDGDAPRGLHDAEAELEAVPEPAAITDPAADELLDDWE